MSRQATSRLKVNPPLGLRPVPMNCRVEDLHIDDAYQRSIEGGASQALIRKIAMFWDWTLFHPLSVARRPDGRLFVVDGQHRLDAARQRGDMIDLPCVVSEFATVQDEAASFVAMNDQRRALSAIDLFKAALASGDEESVRIIALLGECGLSLAPHSNFNNWKPGMVSNVGGIQKCYRRSGPATTLRALRALGQAFDGEILRYAGTIFGGISRFYGATQLVDDAALVRALASKKQKTWMNLIKDQRARSDDKWDIAASRVIALVYVGKLPTAPTAPTAQPASPAPAPSPVAFRKPLPPIKPVSAPIAAPRARPAASGDWIGKRWCNQCDRNCHVADVARCRDPLCRLR